MRFVGFWVKTMVFESEYKQLWFQRQNTENYGFWIFFQLSVWIKRQETPEFGSEHKEASDHTRKEKQCDSHSPLSRDIQKSLSCRTRVSMSSSQALSKSSSAGALNFGRRNSDLCADFGRVRRVSILWGCGVESGRPVSKENVYVLCGKHAIFFKFKNLAV